MARPPPSSRVQERPGFPRDANIRSPSERSDSIPSVPRALDGCARPQRGRSRSLGSSDGRLRQDVAREEKDAFVSPEEIYTDPRRGRGEARGARRQWRRRAREPGAGTRRAGSQGPTPRRREAASGPSRRAKIRPPLMPRPKAATSSPAPPGKAHPPRVPGPDPVRPPGQNRRSATYSACLADSAHGPRRRLRGAWPHTAETRRP